MKPIQMPSVARVPWHRALPFRLLVLLLTGVACSGMSGCNIVAPLYAVAKGPPTREAEFVLSDVKTVVYVDDRNNRLPTNPQRMRRAIADRVANDLIVKQIRTKGPQVLPENMIRPVDAMRVAEASDRAGALMPLDEIGRRVGAEQLIFVDIVRFRYSEDNATPRPVAAANVRVLDLVGRQRVYPTDGSDARMVEAQIFSVEGDLYQSRAGLQAIGDLMSEELGKQIGRLFYKHEPKEIGELLTPR